MGSRSRVLAQALSNIITRPVEAAIIGDGTLVKTIATGNAEGVTLSAKDNSVILASAGSLSAAVGVGASTGVGGSMGASVVVNVVNNSIDTHISGAKIVSAKNVDLDAEANASIWALAIAGSLGVGVGKPAGIGGGASATGVGVAISGTCAINIVADKARSTIDQDSQITSTSAGTVSLDAHDTTLIMADAGGVSLGIGSGQSTGVGVALGGSVAVNVVNNEAKAGISDAVVGTAGSRVGAVSLNATSNSKIWALTIAGSVAVGAGQNRFGGALAGAAAGSVNVVHNTVESSIRAASSVRSNATVSLRAADQSVIVANGFGGSLAVGAGKTGLAAAVGGSFAINSIGNTVGAFVDASTLDSQGAVMLSAMSDSSIWGLAIGAAVGVGVGSAGGTGASLSIGVTAVNNRIDNVTSAFIRQSASVLTSGGDVVISARDTAAIKAISVAASISVGATKGEAGVALSGGGAGAGNTINSTTNAYIDNSTLGTVANRIGKLDLDASSSAEILAIVPAVSASVSYGSTAGVGVAIGVSVARNVIGASKDSVAADYLSTDKPVAVQTGKRVRISGSGPLQGNVYEYAGTGLANANGIDLSTQSYNDANTWHRVDLRPAASEIRAYIRNSSIQAGDVTADAVSTASIDALVIAGAVALAGGGKFGVAVSGAGVVAANTIATSVHAFIDGDGASGINANSLALTAEDSSAIRSIAGAAAISGSVGGKAGLSVAVGLSVAYNRIANSVDAFVANADQGITTRSGDVALSATSRGKHLFDNGISLTTASLDDAAKADEDDPATTSLNEATADDTADTALLETIRGNFAAKGHVLAGELRLTTMTAGKSWSLATGGGLTYFIEHDGTKFSAYQASISAVTAAASLGVSLSTGGASVAVSGAGALGMNIVLTKTQATIDNSKIVSARDVLLTAESSSGIAAVTGALAGSVAIGTKANVGVSIGGAVAVNYIGYDSNSTKAPATIHAKITNSSIDALRNVTLSASASQSIGAVTLAGSVALAAGGGASVAVAGSGVLALNMIGAEVKSFIDGDVAIGGGVTAGIRAANVALTATDTSSITALAGAASVAVGLGNQGVAVGIGVSLGHNMITNDVAAYIANVDQGIVASGNVSITAHETATIHAVSAAAAISAGFGSTGVAVSGAGAVASNLILTKTNAYVDASKVNAGGNVSVLATNAASIKAIIGSTAFAAAAGSTGVGASIGVALASNVIGWESVLTTLYDYTTADDPKPLAKGKRVKIEGGVRAGDIYEFLGTPDSSTMTFNLRTQDYGNKVLWRQVNLAETSIQVLAYLRNSSVNAGGDISILSTSNQSIDAIVVAGSAAISGGSVGVSLSGAGAGAMNRISADVQAYIDGDGTSGITADSIALAADDTSRINAITGAATLAGGFGATGVAVSVGVAVAHNSISNDVAAFITRADTGVTATVGDISLAATESSNISAVTAAASLSAGFGSVGVAVSGAGAAATNSILTRTNAYVADSKLITTAATGDVLVKATDTSTIEANVLAASASAGIGAVGVGVSIGAAYAANMIGYSLLLGAIPIKTPSQVQAYVEGSHITAGGNVTLEAIANETITARIFAGSVAFAAGSVGVAVGGSGVLAVNMISTDVKALIRKSSTSSSTASNVTAASVSLTADDTSRITAYGGAASVSGGFGAVGVAVSIGASIAHNQIDNDVEASITNSTVTTTSGAINVAALEHAQINAVTAAASLAVGIGAVGVSVSGAGAEASNVILTKTNAFVEDSTLDSAAAINVTAKSLSAAPALSNLVVGNIDDFVAKLDDAGSTDPDNTNTSGINEQTDDIAADNAFLVSLAALMTTHHIVNSGSLAVTTRTAGEEWSVTDRVTGSSYIIEKKVGAGGTAKITVSTPSIAATVIATSASAGIGAVGVGVSIGVSFATNLIGWAPATNTAYDYSTADAPASLTTGKRVKIESGVRGGDVFEYLGTPTLTPASGASGVNLKTQDYNNTDLWKQVNLAAAPAEVQAYLRNSTVTAVGGLNQIALSDQSIDALVVAGSAAISAGAVGVGVSGAGAGAVNIITTEVKAFIEGDGTGINTGGIALSATDTSSISAVTGAASIAAAFGAVGVGVSIGVAGAHNEISNDVAAYITNADTGVTASGPVSITAKEAATINALTSAASLGVGIGAVGVAVSGAGAGATNIILTRINAYVADSTLTTTGATGTVAISAEDSSAINAIVATTSASVGIGAVGVGVSLGASVARNLIGYNLLDVRTPAQVQAAITHSTVNASGALSQTATTNETIRAAVLSGSAAISAGAVGVAVSGSGVLAINMISHRRQGLHQQRQQRNGCQREPDGGRYLAHHCLRWCCLVSPVDLVLSVSPSPSVPRSPTTRSTTLLKPRSPTARSQRPAAPSMSKPWNTRRSTPLPPPPR